MGSLILTFGVMKLLNCTTLRIEEFVGSSGLKPYAILSHRWEAEEVTYQDVVHRQALEQTAGWRKIRGACRVARSKGYEYVWVDSCCINKQDFSELTETINSMFKWYANSAVCLAYLSDVGLDRSSMETSLWFTRGWTLQELIAPKTVVFFDGAWNQIGTRASFSNEIHMRTHIDKNILHHDAFPEIPVETILSEVPLARRMSWASRRITTREEDTAYSLLGIFGINMPLLYGEGSNAFMRLQTEIMKETNDMTLFAWTWCSSNPGQKSPPEYRGILATSPREFEDATDLVLSRDIKYNPEYTMTNKGLRIVTEISMAGDMTQYLKLGCHRKGVGKPLGIPLKDHGGGVFLRSQPGRLCALNDEERTETLTLYVKKHIEIEAGPSIVAQTKWQVGRGYRFHIDLSKTKLQRIVPESLWNRQKRMFTTEGLDSFNGFVEFQLIHARFTHESFIVACGFNSSGSEWIGVASNKGKQKEMYFAAINGDLQRLQELAIGANQTLNNQVMAHKGASLLVGTQLRKNEQISDIYIEDFRARGRGVFGMSAMSVAMQWQEATGG